MTNLKAEFDLTPPNYGTGPAWDAFQKDWKNSSEYKEKLEIKKKSEDTPYVQHKISRCLKGLDFTPCDKAACIDYSEKEYTQEWIDLAKKLSEKECFADGMNTMIRTRISVIENDLNDCRRKAPFRDRRICKKIEENEKSRKAKKTNEQSKKK